MLRELRLNNSMVNKHTKANKHQQQKYTSNTQGTFVLLKTTLNINIIKANNNSRSRVHLISLRSVSPQITRLMSWLSPPPTRQGVAGVDSDVANTENDMQATLACEGFGAMMTPHTPSCLLPLFSLFAHLSFSSSLLLPPQDLIFDQGEICAKSGPQKALKTDLI